MIEGPALRSLEELQGPFDLVFIDADKVSYDAYFEAVLPKLAGHGLIVVDNTLQCGGVLASEKDPHEGARALRAFNDKVVNDPRVVCVLTTIRDGVTLIRRAACTGLTGQRPPCSTTTSTSGPTRSTRRRSGSSSWPSTAPGPRRRA